VLATGSFRLGTYEALYSKIHAAFLREFSGWHGMREKFCWKNKILPGTATVGATVEFREASKL
jgi:hypothetical protein